MSEIPKLLRSHLNAICGLLATSVALALSGCQPSTSDGNAVAALEKMGCSVSYGNGDGEKLLDKDKLRSVTKVIGSRSQVTDSGMVHLEGLTELKDLDLDWTQVTDAGLLHLAGLTRLYNLGLNRTKTTDAGMTHLVGLTQLAFLDLTGTQVTDAALVHLRGLTQLAELDISDTKVTDAGVQRLQNALPNCKINSQFGNAF